VKYTALLKAEIQRYTHILVQLTSEAHIQQTIVEYHNNSFDDDIHIHTYRVIIKCKKRSKMGKSLSLLSEIVLVFIVFLQS